MNRGLRGDRATSAVPVSLASRVTAWAKESLLARAIGIAGGLMVLSVIGGSALAGNVSIGGAVAADAGAPMPATSMTSSNASSIPASAPATSVDAGGVGVPIPSGAHTAEPGTDTHVATETAPAPPAAANAGATRAARATPDDPVDLNAATADDLRRLPGVGAKRADAILALRARQPGARFRQIEDLLKVKGIGRAMLRRLHPLVRLG